MAAADQGHEAAVRQLLAARAAVDTQDEDGGSGRGLAVQGLRRRGPAGGGERIAGALVLVPIPVPVPVAIFSYVFIFSQLSWETSNLNSYYFVEASKYRLLSKCSTHGYYMLT